MRPAADVAGVARMVGGGHAGGVIIACAGSGIPAGMEVVARAGHAVPALALPGGVLVIRGGCGAPGMTRARLAGMVAP